MKECEQCGRRIPATRLRTLPEVKVCVACSTEQRRRGYIELDRDLAPHLIILDAQEAIAGGKNC